jgi:ketosteroid isomerase-like protein
MAKDTEMAAQAARTAEHFAGALIAGDAAAAAVLFSNEGICLSRDGTEVRGRGAIGALLAQLTSSEHRLQVRLGRTVLGGGVALSTQFWTRRSKSRGREGFEAQSTARLVLGVDGGRWRILIASPWE